MNPIPHTTFTLKHESSAASCHTQVCTRWSAREHVSICGGAGGGLPVPGYGERGAELAPQPRVQAAAAPRRARHVLHVVVQPPRRVPAVHIVHVREPVLTPPLDRVVVRQKRVQTESNEQTIQRLLEYFITNALV